MDITQLILDDHHEQRRLFAIIEQVNRSDVAALAAVWGRLYPEAGIPQLLSDVIDVFEQGEAHLRNQEDAEYARRERAYEKAERLHEKVVQAECPFWHAPAGTECRARSGSSLGISDHKARKRATQAG